MTQSEPILKVEGLTKRFQTKLAVDNLTFFFKQGIDCRITGWKWGREDHHSFDASRVARTDLRKDPVVWK